MIELRQRSNKVYRVHGRIWLGDKQYKASKYVEAENEVVARALAHDHWPNFHIETIQEVPQDG